MMQRGNRRYQFEVAVGEWVCHHIPFDKLDASLQITTGPCFRDGAVIQVDSDHLRAMLGQASCQQAPATSHVESAPAAWRSRLKYQMVIVNIVVPRAQTHDFHRHHDTGNNHGSQALARRLCAGRVRPRLLENPLDCLDDRLRRFIGDVMAAAGHDHVPPSR